METTETTIAKLRQAIDALYELASTDDANSDTYIRQIQDLEFGIIDAAWGDVVRRTEGLAQASAQIENAIRLAEGAGGGAPVAQIVSRLRAIAEGLVSISPSLGAKSGDARGGLAMGRSPEALPMGRLSVLCVHGVGDHRSGEWKHQWLEAMQRAVDRWNRQTVVEPTFCDYDDLVVEHGVNAVEYAEAIARLGWSGIWHGVGDLFHRPRGLFDVPEAIRWSAGMVAQWSADEKFRQATRQRVNEYLERPFDAVFAHSLGSLVIYDALLLRPKALGDGALITFGSQIGNPFVRGAFGGSLAPLPPAARWYHLYNQHDRVFTDPVRLAADNFTQIDTHFDTPGSVINHDAVAYLGHENTISRVWQGLVARARSIATPGEGGARGPRAGEAMPMVQAVRAVDAVFAAAERTPTQRALLIGINQYPDPADRLEGCVNDVFKMSALLQEMSFQPDEIRVVLDDRATAAGIRERLDWLTRDVRPGDTRVLFYSGHGAQIATYGPNGEPDHLNECLVGWDFDWTPERAITDDDLFEYYANLPYDPDDPDPKKNVSFVIMLDCCHSGGMARGGAAPRARGLAPPDDIRHRALRWERTLNMWVPRDFKSTLAPLAGGGRTEAIKRRREEITGQSGFVHRLGGAAPLRWREPARGGGSMPGGRRPFMPLIIQACQEDQFAYEYRHGVEAYGAFTWTMASALAFGNREGDITFEQLVQTATQRLGDLGYAQRPDLRGPMAFKRAAVPWKPPPSVPPAPPAPPKKRRAGRSAGGS